MARDIFQETVATYRDEAGAAAYVGREKGIEAVRAASAYRLLEGVEVAGLKVLDFGCGYGRDVAEFRRRGADAYGVDVSEALLAYARDEVGPYFANSNIRGDQALPFGEDFDLIWSYAVFVHVPREELRCVLARMWASLKIGGRLILATKRGDGEEIMRNLGEHLPRIMVFYQIDEILSVVRELGGEVEMADADFSVRTASDSLLALRVRKVV